MNAGMLCIYTICVAFYTNFHFPRSWQLIKLFMMVLGNLLTKAQSRHDRKTLVCDKGTQPASWHPVAHYIPITLHWNDPELLKVRHPRASLFCHVAFQGVLVLSAYLLSYRFWEHTRAPAANRMCIIYSNSGVNVPSRTYPRVHMGYRRCHMQFI